MKIIKKIISWIFGIMALIILLSNFTQIDFSKVEESFSKINDGRKHVIEKVKDTEERIQKFN